MVPLVLTGCDLTIRDVVDVARRRRGVRLCDQARERMADSRTWVATAAAGEITDADGNALPIYGVNTGYGSLARMRIDADRIGALSRNLIRSHATGVGPPLPREVVRAMMLLRANALAKGASGCRPALVDTLLAMLEADLVPEVPSRGSCGSSGDLAPLAHLGLVVFRCEESDEDSSGVAWFGTNRLPGADAMARAGIARLDPQPKEGLAMTNGAQLCTALGALACADAHRLVLSAEIAAAMSWESLRGVTRALHPDVHALRPYPGAIATAANLRRLLAGSTLADSLPGKLQDAYSLRCMPQVMGAIRDAIVYVGGQLGIELNAVTDNPLILMDGAHTNRAFSAGHFHGEPVGMACDHLKLAAAEIGNISERRTYRLTTGTLSAQLPPLLAGRDRPSLGLMVPQTTAAALVSENRSLCFPSTADSIPTCEDQEDHVAMSTTAARLARDVVANSRRIVAIELLTAAHGLWWRLREGRYATLGAGTAAALECVEAVLGGPRASRGTPGEDIEALATTVADGTLVDAIERALGPLQGVESAGLR